MNTIPNGHNPAWTISDEHNLECKRLVRTLLQMNTILNGQNPEWTEFRMITIPNGHDPE